LKFFVRVALVAAGVLLGLVTLLTLDRFAVWPIDLIANFRVQLLGAAILLTILAAIARARVALVIAAIALVLNAAVVIPSFTGSQPPARKGGPTLVIGHLNAQSGAIDVVAFRRYLRTTRPGFFVILNPNPSTVDALERDAAGYAVIPVHIGGTGAFAWAVALTRVPIFGIRHPPQPGMPKAAMEAIVDLGSTPIAVLFLHTESPYTPARNAHLHRALAAAARWSRAVRLPHLVEGDLNTTPWSAAFDTLLRNGRLHNSLVGFGIQASWPDAYALLRIPIDNCLLSRELTAVDRGTGPSFGSQHRSLHVTIAFRA
jgi:endonuclease/exonuclease/phosphatase family metal-dependent hydrolase